MSKSSQGAARIVAPYMSLGSDVRLFAPDGWATAWLAPCDLAFAIAQEGVRRGMVTTSSTLPSGEPVIAVTGPQETVMALLYEMAPAAVERMGVAHA